MNAIENVNPADLVTQAEADVTKERTDAAVSYLKQQIRKRDGLRKQLQKVEADIDAIAHGDWSSIPEGDDCPYNVHTGSSPLYYGGNGNTIRYEYR